MEPLAVGPQWAEQIAAIRDAHSDATPIRRAKGDSYRLCRDTDAQFMVQLTPATPAGAKPLVMTLRERDFYVLMLDNDTMGRYSSELKTDARTRDRYLVSPWRLDSAILDLTRQKNPGKQFENHTLLTFCVAESLRSEALAQQIAQVLLAGQSLNIQQWVTHIRDWEVTSRHLLAQQVVPSNLRDYAAGLKLLCRSRF